MCEDPTVQKKREEKKNIIQTIRAQRIKSVGELIVNLFLPGEMGEVV